MKKLISGILIAVTIIFIGVAISIMILGTRAQKNNELFFIFDYSFSVVPTDSMIGDLPDSIDIGDVVIIKRSPFEDIKIGDVIVYQDVVTIGGRARNLLVIHRVVGYHLDGGFETKGDNPANSVDPNPVTLDNFQGEFHSKITFLRPLVNLITNSKNIIFLVLFTVLAILLVLELVKIYKTFNKEKEEKLEEKHQREMAEMKKEQQQKLYKEILEEEKKISGPKS